MYGDGSAHILWMTLYYLSESSKALSITDKCQKGEVMLIVSQIQCPTTLLMEKQSFDCMPFKTVYNIYIS